MAPCEEAPNSQEVRYRWIAFRNNAMTSAPFRIQQLVHWLWHHCDKAICQCLVVDYLVLPHMGAIPRVYIWNILLYHSVQLLFGAIQITEV